MNILPLNPPGLFFVFEGGEGAGKTTQTKRLDIFLRSLGLDVVVTREPGGTDLGQEVRRLLLERDGISLARRAELLLFLVDRAQHVEQVIKPALEAGKIVICDRFSASTIVYQAMVGGLSVNEVTTMSDWSASKIRPDWTFYLDVDPAMGLERARQTERTRFEDKTLEYHQQIRHAFNYMALHDPRWTRVDTNGRGVGWVGEYVENVALSVINQWATSTNKWSSSWPDRHPQH